MTAALLLCQLLDNHEQNHVFLTGMQCSQVAGLHGVAGLAAGGLHTLAVKHTGEVLAWGANQNGVLGGGRTQQNAIREPMPVPGIMAQQVGLQPSTLR